MNRSRCGLAVTPRKPEPCSLRELVHGLVAAEAPMLVWAEPEPYDVDAQAESGRRGGFEPLVAGTPNWPESLAIAEARLFWPERSVHIVSQEGGGCVWSELRECAEGAGLHVSRLPRRVYTIQDLHRFGIEGVRIDGALVAIEYSEQGRLVAWRLIVEGKGQ